MFSRRAFLKGGVLFAASFVLPWGVTQAAVRHQTLPPGTADSAGTGPILNLLPSTPSLDPLTIPKYAENLVIPPPMPRTRVILDTDGKEVDYYEIGMRQFQQQILPPPFNESTVWSYGPAGSPRLTNDAFNYPAFTIEAQAGRPVRVRWENQLTQKIVRLTPSGPQTIESYRPHLFAVDQTLHWAYPPAGPGQTDVEPKFDAPPGPYLGPVPMVPHVHGAHTTEDSDGFASAWWLPAADDIPTSYARTGMDYDKYKTMFENKHRSGPNADWEWTPGSAVFQYPNEQRASTIWYHDHSLGMTRLNVYAGPAGFFLVRSDSDQYDGLPLPSTPNGPRGVLPGPAPQPGDGPFPTDRFEIPIAVQDRSFNTDGSLFYPNSREFFDEFAGPYRPSGTSDIPPIWNPEFFGNTIVVNGRTWPVLHVEPRRYRFRFLNGCQARTLILKLSEEALAPRPITRTAKVPPFWVIGTEGGFLPDQAISLDELIAMPAERFDVIIDFGAAKEAGLNELYLVNEGPDDPYQGEPHVPSDPATTGQVMKFLIGSSVSGSDTSSDPAVPGSLVLPPISAHFPGQTVKNVRQLSLNELESETLIVTDPDTGLPIPDPVTGEPQRVGPEEALLGLVRFNNGVPMGMPMKWMDEVTEVITQGDLEVWEFYNFTMDAHPIHVHEIEFEILGRQPFDMETGALGILRGPESWETGWKDTVMALPGEITRIRMNFDYLGRYVWHCHIVEHEDNEMMRPLEVVKRIYMPVMAKQY